MKQSVNVIQDLESEDDFSKSLRVYHITYHCIFCLKLALSKVSNYACGASLALQMHKIKDTAKEKYIALKTFYRGLYKTSENT